MIAHSSTVIIASCLMVSMGSLLAFDVHQKFTAEPNNGKRQETHHLHVAMAGTSLHISTNHHSMEHVANQPLQGCLICEIQHVIAVVE